MTYYNIYDISYHLSVHSFLFNNNVVPATSLNKEDTVARVQVFVYPSHENYLLMLSEVDANRVDFQNTVYRIVG